MVVVGLVEIVIQTYPKQKHAGVQKVMFIILLPDMPEDDMM